MASSSSVIDFVDECLFCSKVVVPYKNSNLECMWKVWQAGQVVPRCRFLAWRFFGAYFFVLFKALVKTAGGKHEGGDAHWEENKLNNYADSEIRLAEIQEDLCNDLDNNSRDSVSYLLTLNCN